MNEKSKYAFLTYVFLVVTLLIIFVFTKNLYFEFVQNNEHKKTLQQSIVEKNKEYDALTKIKADVTNPKNKDLHLNKFLIKFSEDELLEYFYTYANAKFSKVKIESINLSEGKVNEFGMNEAQVDLIANFSQEQDMIDMINFLLQSDKYNFYIHNFDYQFGTDTTDSINVSIPLKVLYK